MTLIAAMSSIGVIHSKIIDNGTCTSAKFKAFVEELVTLLHSRSFMEGGMIFMDNARIHNPQRLKNLLERNAFTLKLLSPYSYMLNPFEYVFFFKIKTSARRILGEIRTQTTGNNENKRRLQEVIFEAVREVTTEYCVGYVI